VSLKTLFENCPVRIAPDKSVPSKDAPKASTPSNTAFVRSLPEKSAPEISVPIHCELERSSPRRSALLRTSAPQFGMHAIGKLRERPVLTVVSVSPEGFELLVEFIAAEKDDSDCLSVPVVESELHPKLARTMTAAQYIRVRCDGK
jgi:hypothetical protein